MTIYKTATNTLITPKLVNELTNWLKASNAAVKYDLARTEARLRAGALRWIGTDPRGLLVFYGDEAGVDLRQASWATVEQFVRRFNELVLPAWAERALQASPEQVFDDNNDDEVFAAASQQAFAELQAKQIGRR